MIKFDRLFAKMKQKKVTYRKLETDIGISAGILGRLRHGGGLTTHTIDKLCNYLDCEPMDIMDYIPDSKQSEAKKSIK